MKNFLKKLLICLLIISSLTILSGCNNGKKSEEDLLKEKLNTEISYMDEQLISMANELNNINYTKYKVVSAEEEKKSNKTQDSNEKQESKSGDTSSGSENSSGGSGDASSSSEGLSSGSKAESSESEDETEKVFTMNSNNVIGREMEVDWQNLKKQIETTYTVLTTVTSDLKEIGIPDEELNNFTQTIDKLTIAIKNEQKEETLNNIVAVYEFLPRFMKVYDRQNAKQEILVAKYNLLLCYKDVTLNMWENLENDINNLKLSYSNIENKKEQFQGKEVNIKNGALIIEELKNSSEIKEQDIFFIKYRNLIQEMNILNN